MGGDDRLWGDTGDGAPTDHDIMLGGQGDDDLIGGQGTNDLLAWSINPNTASTQLHLPLGVSTVTPAASATSVVTGTAALAAPGMLSNDARFTIAIGSATPVMITVSADSTRLAHGVSDLVAAVMTGLHNAGLDSQITATLGAGGKLILTALGTGVGKAITIN